jgi:glyoxylase-like metal-dependent hydrolase (beta-lactamase superfamily II)
MVHVLDTHHLGRPGIIAAIALATRDGLVLFDCGPASTFPDLTSELARIGATPEEVRHVFLSHIHLDHAGAAWCFAARGAKIHVHPRGARHLTNPARLVESARRIFGAEMDRLWGEVRPIPEEALRITTDGNVCTFGGVQVRALDTPGHASHHNVYHWENELFGGDVAGVQLRGGPPVPPFVPPELDIEAWQESIRKIAELRPRRMFLPHFGAVEGDIEQRLEQLSARVARWAEWFRQRIASGGEEADLAPEFAALEAAELRDGGIDADGIADYERADPSYMAVAAAPRYWKDRSDKSRR